MVNFSERYIPNLATKTEPLRKLTKKNSNFVWTQKEENCFKELRKSLINEPVLGHFKLNAEKTQLICDASNVGLCGILVQIQDGFQKVISYASRSLTDVEKKYSTTEKEALACVWACERFNIYLCSLEFELITDHKPLEAIFKPTSKPCARLERWMMRLMPYNFTVTHLPGNLNIADYLSRLGPKVTSNSPLTDKTEEYVRFIATEATPNGITTRTVEETSKEDPEFIALRQSIRSGNWTEATKKYYPMREELMVIGYVVLRGNRIVVPQGLRLHCVKLAHQGHQGIVKTKQRLRTKVWWPQLEKDVEKFCKSCHSCQLVSTPNPPEPIQPTTLPNGPWQDLSIDFLGPLDSGKHFVLVVVDYYSRWFDIEITKDTTSSKVISTLRRLFTTHGLPFSITSDNAANFKSQEFETYLEENGIDHRLVTPLHPAANGEVERQNRSLMKRIRIAKAENKNWQKEIHEYIFAYRTTPHSVTGLTPAEIMFNRKLRTKLPEFNHKQEDEEVRDRDKTHKVHNKNYLDAKRNASQSDLEVGDAVLLKQSERGKMDTTFCKDPYQLVAKSGNSCTIESPEGVRYKRNSTFLKKYNAPTETEHFGTDKTPITSENVLTENEAHTTQHKAELNDDNIICDDSLVSDNEGNKDINSPLKRPVRTKTVPAKFKDFVMEK